MHQGYIVWPPKTPKRRDAQYDETARLDDSISLGKSSDVVVDMLEDIEAYHGIDRSGLDRKANAIALDRLAQTSLPAKSKSKGAHVDTDGLGPSSQVAKDDSRPATEVEDTRSHPSGRIQSLL